MHIFAYACMVFGATLALTGIVLFVKMGTQGTSSVKMFGFEFQLGGSALVIFVVGALLFIMPVIYADRLLVKEKSDDLEISRPTPTRDSSETAQPTPSAFVLLDEDGMLQVDQGVFSTPDDCRARIRVLADSDDFWEASTAAYSRCDAAPSEVFCLSYFENRNEKWVCYSNLNGCRGDLEAYQNINIRCERIALNQALPKLR